MSGIFSLHPANPLPTPMGIDIENEGDDIVYLDSSLDKLSMCGDRLRIVNDLNTAIRDTKHEQTGKAN